MAAPGSKRSPAWSTPELLDLLALWGEEAGQSQLPSSCRNFDTYGQISCGRLDKGYERDTHQCHTKIKELRQAYQKARESNSRSGAAPKTCRFYKELDTILGSDPTSTAKSPANTLVGLETADIGINPEDKIIDEEVKLEDDVEHKAGLSSGTGGKQTVNQDKTTVRFFGGEQRKVILSHQNKCEHTSQIQYRSQRTIGGRFSGSSLDPLNQPPVDRSPQHRSYQ
ncbi:Zinc finger and SCAN domain-containing protein 29 [Chelonia mydas]|uniref:Zinc finger and SCAN domain-containing protein 29 n=1 Tax=Chelonia mydas TaxID=8469 RepID=M7APD8_CHEMY|nr:Zinc finger and SCAN domain-containing protein 29 [Chelonia mydas]